MIVGESWKESCKVLDRHEGMGEFDENLTSLGIVPEKQYEEARILSLIKALNQYADDGVLSHRVTVVWAEELAKRLRAFNG